MAAEKPIVVNMGHTIGAAKLIVAELQESEDYYQEFFDMEVLHRVDNFKEIFSETILTDSANKHLALFAPTQEMERPLQKTVWPVLQIDTPDFRGLTKKLDDAGRRVHYFSVAGNEIAVTKDPSANVVEIIERGESTLLGGTKIIVEDRQSSEDFYRNILAIETSEYFSDETFDEAIFNFKDSLYLALIEPTKKEDLLKSSFPVVAIYTDVYEELMQRIKETGTEVSEFYPGNIFIAKDPNGNCFEIVRAGFDINSV